MKRIRFIKTLRRIWVVAGLTFMIWLGLSFQARDLPPGVLSNGPAATVDETGEAIRFTPQTSQPALNFIFLPGAFVDPRAYAPLGHALAEHNIQTFILKLPFHTALLGAQEASVYDRILALIQQVPEVQTWAIGGHSRGCAIAARFASRHPNSLNGLKLIGTSHPKDEETDLSGASFGVVKVYGTRDGLASEAEFLANRKFSPPEAQFVRLEGANHAQFDCYGFQLGDQSAAITREEQLRLTVEASNDAFTELSR